MAKQTFTTGQVLSAAQMTSLQQTAMGGGSATAKTASYVLVAADAGCTILMNAAGATTITVNTGLFAAGDTVFIQNIGAGVCTITAGTATVNTAGSLALGQYEGGTLYFTATGAAVFNDYVQAASGGGKVLQVVNATTSTTATSTSSSYADTNLTATITPTLATSKVLVIVHQTGFQKATQDTYGLLRLMRGATQILQFEAQFGNTGTTTTNEVGGSGCNFLDSPATTSATTYKTQFANGAATGNIRVQNGSCSSSITLMEIGA